MIGYDDVDVIPISKRCLAECVLLFLLAAVLIKPLFKLGYTDKWASVEGAILSDARYLNDHWPHPSWEPLWYAGARFDSLFPPAVRYGTVAIAKLSRVPVVRAFHIYEALFYCLGIAAVYFITWVVTGARATAWLTAAAAALVSPSFLFVSELRNDAWLWTPQRLGAMMRYGDGPHIASLAVLPIALAFQWRALGAFRRLDVALACLSGAVVAAHSLAGAAVLLLLFAIMLWSLYVTHLQTEVWKRAAILGALTYGLCAFWLVPSMIKTSIANTQFLSQGGTTWSLWIALACALAFVQITNTMFRGQTNRAYLIFLTGATACFAVNVIGRYHFGFQLFGASVRQVPELDLFLILLTAEVVRRLPWRAVAIGIAILALTTSNFYLRRAWHMFPADPGYKERNEYKVQEWASEHMPAARFMVAGTPRLWFDAWADRQQVGGESESGLPGPVLNAAQFQILNGDQPALAVYWMQILGVDAVVFQKWGKFAGTLPLLWDDGKENAIYRVPRRYPAQARVVNTAQWNALPPMATNNNAQQLKAYFDALENGPASPIETTDAIRIKTHTEPGESIIVQTMHDDGWRAHSNGSKVPLQKTTLGLIRLDPAPGNQDISLTYHTPLEAWLGRLITLASLIALFIRKERT